LLINRTLANTRKTQGGAVSAAKYDAVIIGGGHNRLTCGACLARAGKNVLVLERCGSSWF
jgi:choline dehydrogenase-like flavoprotein